MSRVLRRRAPYSTAARPARPVSARDLDHFATVLPPGAILSTLAPGPAAAPADLAPYNTDWLGRYVGAATTVLRPRTTAHVSSILRHCWQHSIPVVPQGGNTGLVGGAVPRADELIVSLAAMADVRSFDSVSGILVADAGCILQSLSDHIAPFKFMMPLDLGAKGSCHIGGNVATNAGGLRFLRYGSLHGSVLGLEVVLPDGTVLDQLSTLRKDNTGYDLKQLFIGSEGTLGIITAVAILTPAAPHASTNVIFALPSFANVRPLYKVVREHLSEILSAFEYIDRAAYDLTVKHGHGPPFDPNEIGDAECFVLVETSGSNRDHDEAKITALFDVLMQSDTDPLIATGVMSQSPGQFASLWALREGVTEAASREGKVYKYDISVPLPVFKDVVDVTRKHLQDKGLFKEGGVKEVIGFGHIGDGNLHLNIIAAAYTKEIEEALEPFVYELVASHNGSVSAEHGIGVAKTKALHYSKDALSREWMVKIKELFDSRGIMNPGKIFA